MLIGFTGTQSGMTAWQKKQVEFLLKEKECTELMFYDVAGANVEAGLIALLCKVQTFTIYIPYFDKYRGWLFNKKGLFPPTGQYIQIPYLLDLKPATLNVKWEEAKKFKEAHEEIINKCAFILAAPKEHKFSIRSATWGVIKNAWKLKKDIIIIPPIERPDEIQTDRESES